MLNKIVAGSVMLAIGALLLGAGGLAVFTDSAAVSGNDFSTGDVDISASPATAVVTFANMAPGDRITDDVVVANDGSLDLRYAITASATSSTPELKDQLSLIVKTVDVTTPGTPCDNFDGTQVYSGDLDGTGGVVMGSNAQGAQAGDRTLTAGNNETLCFRVELPLATGNSYQTKSTTATFTFDAEQTTNNP